MGGYEVEYKELSGLLKKTEIDLDTRNLTITLQIKVYCPNDKQIVMDLFKKLMEVKSIDVS